METDGKINIGQMSFMDGQMAYIHRLFTRKGDCCIISYKKISETIYIIFDQSVLSMYLQMTKIYKNGSMDDTENTKYQVSFSQAIYTY